MASTSEPASGGGGRRGGDDDGDEEDVLRARRRSASIPARVPCLTLAAATARSGKKAIGADPTLVNVYYLIAATFFPHEKMGSLIDAYKNKGSSFSTPESRAILAGTSNKASFGNAGARKKAVGADYFRAPGGLVVGYEVLAHLFAACPYILLWRFECEPWAMGIDSAAKVLYDVAIPALCMNFFNDAYDEAETRGDVDTGAEADGSPGTNPADSAYWRRLDDPGEGSQPGSLPGQSPAREAASTTPTSTARTPPRSSPRRRAGGVGGFAAAQAPGPTVHLTLNKSGDGDIMGFVCPADNIALHLDKLTTHYAIEALGSAVHAAKLAPSIREDMGDLLRIRLRPPQGGRVWDSSLEDEYVIECRPNYAIRAKLISMAKATSQAASIVPGASGAGGAQWTWRSMVRLIEIWSIQEGSSFTWWKNDVSHGIPSGKLHEVATSWKLILEGSTDRADLDTGQLKHTAKWAAPNSVFADADCKISIRARLRGLFEDESGGNYDLPAHPVNEAALSAKLASFRSVYSQFITRYHASGANNSEEEKHTIAEEVLAKVMQAKTAAAAAPDNGFGCTSSDPFDDGAAPKNPLNFLTRVSSDMASTVLYAWALSSEFPDLEKRLAKMVDEDYPCAGEAGLLDLEGYEIVAPGAGLRSRMAEQSKKRKAYEGSGSSLADAIRDGSEAMANAVLRLCTPDAADGKQSAAEKIQITLAAAEAAYNAQIKRRTKLFGQLEVVQRAGHGPEHEQDVQADLARVRVAIAACVEEIDRLQLSLVAAQSSGSAQ